MNVASVPKVFLLRVGNYYNEQVKFRGGLLNSRTWSQPDRWPCTDPLSSSQGFFIVCGYHVTLRRLTGTTDTNMLDLALQWTTSATQLSSPPYTIHPNSSSTSLCCTKKNTYSTSEVKSVRHMIVVCPPAFFSFTEPGSPRVQRSRINIMRCRKPDYGNSSLIHNRIRDSWRLSVIEAMFLNNYISELNRDVAWILLHN